MEEAARPATTDDVAAVVSLAAAAAVDLGAAKGGPLFLRREGLRPDVDAGIRAALADPDHFVVVGTLDDVIVGYVAGHCETLADGGRLGIIEDLYVLAEAREVGIGEAMMAEVVERCRVAGCLGIDARVLPGERLTKNFFESAGFTARLLVVHKRLDPATAAGAEPA